MSSTVGTKDWLFTALRVAVGGVLFYAGFLKLNSAEQFAEAIANYRLLPAQANQFMAVALPWCEVATGILLIAGVWTRAAGIVAVGMFLAFGTAVTLALARGLDIDCGCFGTDASTHVGLKTLAIDVAGLVGAMSAILKPAEQSKVEV